ncbi:ABC transporter substrate-binding protein [Granulosicoccus antarcticus]|uniref:Putrescine-binding periplasmic protein n=1 Tax=Granulosicoccus antarcticus IMCC3135 TaxID=1192854 RepID=A0A2Z2NVV5_9GAMM|nr:spermidine/putrescine ABC transporter substrate-binding protein [Granulosicoccus antarcticus]ASJ75592.1 Spermidine/putrescine-binding periplasmic protein [Granulosicoccus antarcticus IMCC3135]
MQARHTAISRRTFLTGAAALGISFRLPRDALASDGTVNFYNWQNYIGESTLEDFSTASGLAVHYDLFADNDELFAKLRGGNPGYDVIVPSNDYVERMLHAQMLQTLDHSQIPALKNIDPVLMDPVFDPGRQYSLPYLGGTIGIGYRKSAVREIPTSWNDLFTSNQHAGRIALLNDPLIVTRLAIKAMGKSLNDLDPANLAAAEAMISKQRPNIVAFAPDNGQDLLLAGEVDLAMEWNSDMLHVMAEDDDIGYSVPEEGSLIWEDSLCIPSGAPNVDNAHALINFLLTPEIGAAIATHLNQATPNTAARALMSPSYLSNPALSLPPTALKNSEYPLIPSPQTLKTIQQSW